MTKTRSKTASMKAASAPIADPSVTAPPTKLARVVALLRRPQGAHLEELMAETGWQAHSVRGALSGAIKKGLGFKVTSVKTDRLRVYRIVDTEIAA